MAKPDADRPLILIIDEVEPLVRLLVLELSFQGMRTETVLIEDNPLTRAQELHPDAIVVGAVIPTPELYSLVEQLAIGTNAKVLFVNGAGNDSDSEVALQLGAHDAISRPFLPEALGMRLRALLRLDPPEANELSRGGLTIDFLRRIVRKGDLTLALGTSEWTLLLALAQAETAVSALDLLVTVWGPEYASETQFLTIWIQRLRISLGDDPGKPSIVVGDLEKGYRLAS